jgi:hypothetical protein
MRQKPMKKIALTLVILSAGWLQAEVKTQQKSQIQFPGMMGRMMGLFGGKAMREGVIDTVAVKGNRKMTVNGTTGQIIDLDEEKIYDLDMKAKSYHVTTFDQMRRRLEEAQERAKNAPPTESSPQPKGQPKADPNAKEMQIDFDLKESGQKKNINGFDCREVVMTISVHEKGKPLEAGGMVMTAHEWLAPRIAAMKEVQEFDMRYAQKLHGPSFGAAASAEQMAAAMAMYPMLKDAMGKFQAENVNMDGTSILTVMTTETVASPEQMQQQQQQQQQQQKSEANEPPPTSVGGLLGGLGRRAIRNKAQQKQQQQQENSNPGRATMMTMNHELMSVATSVSGGDVAIPSGFKLKN